MPFKHGHQYGKYILLYLSKCCSTHLMQATMHKMENTDNLYNTPTLSSDHFKYLGVPLQSNLGYERHLQDTCTIGEANHTLGLL